jgi:hypothetical protein
MALMELGRDLFVRINLELKIARNILNFILTSAQQCVYGSFNVIQSYKSVPDVRDVWCIT